MNPVRSPITKRKSLFKTKKGVPIVAETSNGVKIIIAPNSFKETLSAEEVANAIEKGIRRVYPVRSPITKRKSLSKTKRGIPIEAETSNGVYLRARIKKFPLADGGDGTVRALVTSTRGKIFTAKVTGPLGEKVKAEIGLLGDKETAVIEMASASGLRLIPRQKRNPLKTTTWGTGELIKACLDKKVEKIIVGIGGSATVDGGAGMAMVLGVKLLDKSNQPIKLGGEGLKTLQHIDCSQLDPRIKHTEFIVASDVTNPLLGSQGAARVYAPQKGASPEMVEQLEKYLRNFARIIEKDMGKKVANIPGSGAAGGLGAGLVAFLDAKIVSGSTLVIRTCGLEQEIKDADLVLTGEGGIDSQTLYGKVPVGVAKLARKYGVRVIVLAGDVRDDAYQLLTYGIDAIFSTTPRIMTFKEVRRNPARLITNTAEQIMRVYRMGAG